MIDAVDALIRYLEHNASGCDAEGADWADLGRALRRRAKEVRKAWAMQDLIKVARLSERPLSTGDKIPDEYRVTLPPDDED